MAFTTEFYEYLQTLEDSNPIGLKAYDYDSPEINRLQYLARQSEMKPKHIRKKQKIPRSPIIYLDSDAVDLENLQRLRKQKIHSYRMAMHLDIGPGTYSRKEKGIDRFREEEITAIAQKLGVEEEELLQEAKG